MLLHLVFKGWQWVKKLRLVGEARREVFGGVCCLELKGLRYSKEDLMLEAVEITGLYLPNHSRRTHLYQSNHGGEGEDPSEEDK